jgi:drug/metabolite transporter (DMT)-like permease
MNKRRVLFSMLEIVLGACMVVYGGYDDSPGGQMLGLVAVIFGIVGIAKSRKKNFK